MTHARRSNGFTLVELLVVVTIISILAGLTLAMLQSARQTARIAKTRATVAKINSFVMAKYQSYGTRRVPMTTAQLQAVAQSRLGWTPGPSSPWTADWAAKARLGALRDMMRMEMPERFSDISGPSIPMFLPTRPSLSDAYRRRIIMPTATRECESAECLYLIVTMACGADARRHFNESEVGDTDNDGLPEFLDGWGQPINFLRWAPGFNDTDLQPAVVPPDQPELPWDDPTVVARKTAAALEDHEPFDTRRVDPIAWRMLPLIWSDGPDGEAGLTYNNDANTYSWQNDTYTWVSGANTGLGQPFLKNGEWRHYDNIHNHHSGGSTTGR